MTDILREVRWAIRRLRNQPAYGLSIVGTTAIAIAVSAIAFSFIDVAVLRPLPFGNPDRTVFVYGVDSQRGFNRGRLSAKEFGRVRTHPALADVAAYTESMLTATGFEEPIRVYASYVTPNLLRTWEVSLPVGNGFPQDTASTDGASLVILSHHFWVARYGADPNIQGRMLLLNERPYTIVGVLPSALEVGDFARTDVWLPLSLDQDDHRRTLVVTASLGQDVHISEAQASIQALANALRREEPAERNAWSLAVLPMREAMTGGDTNVILVLLLLVVLMIFGVACVNVTNMMTADAIARRGDTAMRLALGAALRTLIRHRAIEAALLVSVASAIGLGLAGFGLTTLRASSADAFFTLLTLSPRVLAMTMLWALAFIFVASLMPTLYTWRVSGIGHIRDASSRVGKGKLRAGLVSLQLALSFTLLVISGLSAKTASNIAGASTGLETSGVTMVQLALDGPRYPGQTQISEMIARSIEGLNRLQGIAGAAACAPAPLVEAEPVARFVVPTSDSGQSVANAWAYQAKVSADYFSVFDIPMLHGRTFIGESERLTMVINRAMADRYWGASDPLGRQVRVRRADGPEETRTVVGVVGDVRSNDVRASMPPRMYLPLHEEPPRALTFIVRSSGATSVNTQAVRQAIWQVDRTLALSTPAAYSDLIARVSADDRTIAKMFLLFAGIALALSTGGLYGLTSYGVRQQRASIAIRMALGASNARVIRNLAAEYLRVCLVGGLLGALGAFGAGRLMRGFVYGVAPFDIGILLFVAAILFATAVVAMYLPLRQASKIEAASILRSGV